MDTFAESTCYYDFFYGCLLIDTAWDQEKEYFSEWSCFSSEDDAYYFELHFQ